MRLRAVIIPVLGITATHSSILAWRVHGLYSPWGHKESDTTEQLSVHLRMRNMRLTPDHYTKHYYVMRYLQNLYFSIVALIIKL